MGRSLKRVPLDFNWPIKKIWEGFLNPFYKLAKKCPDCKLGYSKEGQFLHDSFYHMYQTELWAVWAGHNILAIRPRERLRQMGWSDEICDNIDMARKFGLKSLTGWSDKLDESDIKALVDEDRLWDFTREWVNGKWVTKKPAYMPTPDEVNAWSGQGMGHDAINHGILIRHRCKKAGVNPTCQRCKGYSEIWPSPEAKKKSEKWKRVEPPKGKGFQLWETTSEGSPVSPVFKSLDDLCAWAEENANTFADQRATASEWKKMLEKDFVHHQSGNMIFT